MSKAASIQIVRRYGPVGGMERYVWELTHALNSLNQPVTIICEKAYEQAEEGIHVIELGQIRQKPRWLSMLRFSANVSKYLQQHPELKKNSIIHSHERTAEHQVTTFHGPPIKDRKTSWADCLSPRLTTWLHLEKRELLAPNVKAILPNSTLIGQQLSDFYPDAQGRINAPAYPGVAPHFYQLTRTNKTKPTLGFIGKEWKRKGLDLAVAYFKEALKEVPNAHFLVAGPSPEDIQHLFKDLPQQSYTLSGWMKTESFMEGIDLLIHPARKEPFGMVIAEANAVGVMCIISNLCGIAPLITANKGQVLPLTASNHDWKQAIVESLFNNRTIERLDLTWENLAEQHIHLYASLIERAYD